MRFMPLFLVTLLGLISCKTFMGDKSASKPKADKEEQIPDEDTILSQQKFNCQRKQMIYDKAKNTCVDAKVYCESLKDGSIFDGAIKQCLSPELQCLRKPNYTWNGKSCVQASTACTGAKGQMIQGVCVKDQNSCAEAGFRYKWTADSKTASKGSCKLKGFMDYCTDPNLKKPYSDTVTILKIVAGSDNCVDTYEFINHKTSLRVIAKDALTAYDQNHKTNLANELTLSELGPFSDLTALATLELTNNAITDLSPLVRLENLRYLDLQNNQIKSLRGLEPLVGIETLYIGMNEIIKLDELKGMTKLRILDAFSNRLFDIAGIKDLTSLNILRLRGNSLTSLHDLVKLSALTELSVDYNPIAEPNFLKTEDNCPTSFGVAQILYDFCSQKN